MPSCQGPGFSCWSKPVMRRVVLIWESARESDERRTSPRSRIRATMYENRESTRRRGIEQERRQRVCSSQSLTSVHDLGQASRHKLSVTVHGGLAASCLDRSVSIGITVAARKPCPTRSGRSVVAGRQHARREPAVCTPSRYAALERVLQRSLRIEPLGAR